MSTPAGSVLRFDIEGAAYRFDQSRLSIAESRLVKQHTGWGFALWESQLGLLDPDAVAAMVLLAKRRAGEDVEWSDLDEVDLAALVRTFVREDTPADEPGLGAEPNPDVDTSTAI